MTAVPATLGLILAGGRGRRLGGVDKALLPLAGRPLLAHVLARTSPQCVAMVLSANGDPERFRGYALPVVADAEAGGQGPLAGITAGLRWLVRERSDVPWLVSLPVDCPFLPVDLVARLHAGRAGRDAAPAIAVAGGRLQPAVALWPRSALASLERRLAAGELKVETALAALSAVAVPFPSGAPDPFVNLNRPEDVAAAEAALAAEIARPHG